MTTTSPKATRTARGHLTRARQIRLVFLAVTFAALTLTSLAGTAARSGVGCATCHAMDPYVVSHSVGPHAGQSCSACHVPSDLADTLPQGARAIGWSVRSLVGTRPSPSHPDDRPCRACHSAELEGVITANGIAVRHSDFVDRPCSWCHSGTGHALEDRHYRNVEMEDCTSCHTTIVTDTTSCSLCHVDSRQRTEGDTAWRATHGPGWETTHGMGEMHSCMSCHATTYCADCHGVRMPHPDSWLLDHGAAAIESGTTGCATCHQRVWCDDCHGIEMPHGETFLPVHGPSAQAVGDGVCLSCHRQETCDICHLASSHPDVPAIGMRHGR